MPAINISNATIKEISSERGTTFVTVAYREGPWNRGQEQTIRLVVSRRTIILNQNGMIIPASALRVGMTINASFSSAMTRSIPPQAAAYIIKITGRQPRENVTTGRILEIDQRNRSFTTISDRNLSTQTRMQSIRFSEREFERKREFFPSTIRFNVQENTRIFNRMGRPMSFSGLRSGMNVQVRHANFMTASIPPQTTAFEIRVL